jgi:hypothetical protein
MLEQLVRVGVGGAVKRIAWLLFCVCSVTCALSSTVRAEEDARTQRLEGLTDAERQLLAPLMERGPVALIGFSKADALPEVLVAAYADAPAELVAKVISQPADYPKFMHTLDHVEVLSRSSSQVSYKWSWQTGVLFLEGENRMTSLPPPPDHPELGYRISVHSERGALGEGRLMWRVFPVSEKRSMVMLAMRVDMRDANFVMRQLDAASRSVNRSINLALCYVMLLGTSHEAERRAGAAPVAHQVVFAPPKIDLTKYRKLLGRADLLLMELTPKGLGQLTIFGRTGLKPDRLRPVMTEPETFGKALVPGSYTRVTKREGNSKTFEWGINLPLIGSSGTMEMHEQDDTLFIDATEGALNGGKWRFLTPSLPNGEAVVLGYAVFDITRTTWLIEKIASLDPMMGHGLAAASQVMMLRALRRRAHDEAKHALENEKDAPVSELEAHASAVTPAPGDTAKAPAPSAPAAPANAQPDAQRPRNGESAAKPVRGPNEPALPPGKRKKLAPGPSPLVRPITDDRARH